MFEQIKNKFLKEQPAKIVREQIPETGQKVIAGLILVISIVISFYVGKYLTSDAASRIDELTDKNEALREALEDQQLLIIAENIQDQSHNSTTFGLISI